MAKPVHTVQFPLGPSHITIEFVRRLADPDKEHPVLFGITDMDSKTIKINLKAHRDLDHLLSTCFHELIHAYIDITGQFIHLDGDKEESLVRMLESMLFWLVDKKLLTNLLEADKLSSYYVKP